MTARGVAVTKTALAKARERRRGLDRARDAQDERIDEATAMVLVALEGLAEVEAARVAAAVTVGEALRELLAEGVSLERVAALVEIEVGEVRRLSKVTATPVVPTTIDALGGQAPLTGASPASEASKSRLASLAERDAANDGARRAG